MSGRVFHGREIAGDVVLRPDVAVIGSGPGGSIAAAKLAAAGLEVVILEEGAWYETRELDMNEGAAYARLYQDAGSRSTDDLSIIILQGRGAGGGSTVNWMTSLRTPSSTLHFWRTRRDVRDVDEAALVPHWETIERRLNIHPAAADDVSNNNDVLLRGARQLGMATTLLPRNTRECTNLGLCSMGCPIDAKMSAQLTYLADAIAAGASLYADARVTRVEASGSAAVRVHAEILDRESRRPTARRIVVEPKNIFLAAGAINSPALLLRSGITSAPTGRHTWLHPVVAVTAIHPRRIDGWYGSPQSVAVQSYTDRGEKMGYFLESAPLFPILASLAAPWFGDEHGALMQQLPFTSVLIGLTVDGFDDAEEGGTVRVARNGRMRFRYVFTARMREAMNDAMKTLARIHLAAGARRVLTLHNSPLSIEREADIGEIDRAAFGPARLSVFTAHQMGGCAMGEDPRRSVVDSNGRHHELKNLYVVDGSIFPTSLGVNPMLSIYGMSSLLTDRFLAQR